MENDQQHQQWENWEYDMSSGSFDHCNDHEDGVFHDDDSIDESELLFQDEHIRKPSSMMEEDDSKHLFAASFFTHTETDDDGSSVDSSRTTRISNKQLDKEKCSIAKNNLDHPTQIAVSSNKDLAEKVGLRRDKKSISKSVHLHPHQTTKLQFRRRSWPWLESVDVKQGVAIGRKSNGVARAA